MENSNKRDGSASPLSERMAKRTKQTISEKVHLPAEMWASVMNCLDFSSVLSLTATTRTMRDATPFVTELHINKSCQMHTSVGRRFRDVQTIYIYTLIQQIKNDFYGRGYEDGDEDTLQEVDFETSTRALPFVSAFGNLKKIYFGGISVDKTWLYSVVPFSKLNFLFDSFEEQFSRLTDSISAGYRCGALRQSLEVRGLICPQYFRNNECNVCRRACESFPVDSVVDFDCRENSFELSYLLYTYLHSYSLFACCLARDELVSTIFYYTADP